jgi:hypothetical protein
VEVGDNGADVAGVIGGFIFDFAVFDVLIYVIAGGRRFTSACFPYCQVARP